MLLTGVMLSGPAAADMFRCKVGAKTVYQDTPCSGGRLVDHPNGHAVDPAEKRRADERLAAGMADTERRRQAAAQAERTQSPRQIVVPTTPPPVIQRSGKGPDRYYDRPDRYTTRRR